MKTFYRGATAGALALVVALTSSAFAATKPKKVHFTQTAIGAPVSSTEAVYATKDSVHGQGAAVQTTVINSTATAGTDTTTSFFKNGSSVGHDTFTLTAPDANGVITVTGHGTSVGKSGTLKGHKATYTFTGTDNSKTNIIQVTITGTTT
jgi:hypothetical protein